MNDGKSESDMKIAEGRPPAPPSHDDRYGPSEPNISLDEPTAMQIFFAWEKLRIVYNAVLIVLVLGMCGRAIIFLIGPTILSAIGANLMFCAGPVIESYLFWWGVPRSAARWIVFGVGSAIAVGMTGAAADDAMSKFAAWP